MITCTFTQYCVDISEVCQICVASHWTIKVFSRHYVQLGSVCVCVCELNEQGRNHFLAGFEGRSVSLINTRRQEMRNVSPAALAHVTLIINVDCSHILLTG